MTLIESGEIVRESRAAETPDLPRREERGHAWEQVFAMGPIDAAKDVTVAV
jgi:hypothetical protein